jgi:ATPase family associated with various cellular activities (AAA)
MPDIELKRLRDLRRRAQELVSTLDSDMKSFRHASIENGFRRKPTSESDPNDVNITTTASCLMALALAGRLPDLYGREKWKDVVTAIFNNVVQKPWMSSGLTENNAFTTALVIRLYGFLRETDSLEGEDKAFSRSWEAHLDIQNLDRFVAKLLNQTPFSKYLFDLLPRALQAKLGSYRRRDQPKMRDALAAEFNHLINTSNLYDDVRLKKVKLSAETLALAKVDRNAYATVHLNRLVFHDYFKGAVSPLNKKSIRDIAKAMADDVELFKINNYPPSAAVLYWYVDGVHRAKIHLSAAQWERLCRFAATEFESQRSRFDARHAAMMDPVSMVMAACLCARLRLISKDLLLGTTKLHQEILPSTAELETSVADLFLEQTSSGIWPKYFPLFHYQDAGSNFCFTFELLEALLVEFGGKQNHLLTQEMVISGLERAVSYCVLHRLHCSEAGATKREKETYQGWNSGGELESLRQSLPESWATAVVHMFLLELIEVLSDHIQERILLAYSASKPREKWSTVAGLLDIDLPLDHDRYSLKDVLSNTILATFASYNGVKSPQLRRNPASKAPLSALLFGPPGTSKTEVAKAIAKTLEWPLIEIDPATFLRNGYQDLYVQAERIFEDVMDLSGVVVLFDEMDALVQKRDAETTIDIESRFLTTYMLPKLAKLHDKGQIVFLMATNFQATFDDAIKRAGRFDFLLCMGPPMLKDKCDCLDRFVDRGNEKREEFDENIEDASKTIGKYVGKSPWLRDQLSLYTFGEFKSFVSGFGSAKELNNSLRELKEGGFEAAVRKDCESVGLKRDDLNTLLSKLGMSTDSRFVDLDKKPLTEKIVKDLAIDPKIAVVKYAIDRQQTRRQCSAPNWYKVKPLGNDQ